MAYCSVVVVFIRKISIPVAAPYLCSSSLTFAYVLDTSSFDGMKDAGSGEEYLALSSQVMFVVECWGRNLEAFKAMYLD